MTLFEPYGEVVSAIIMKGEQGESKGFGFVCFKNPQSAINAVSELNGKDGLHVVRALKKEVRQAEIRKATERYKNSQSRFNLYIKNFPPHTPEQELIDFFSKFGEVQNVKLMKNAQGENLGYGFVCFKTQDGAYKAKIDGHNLLFNGCKLFIS